MALSPRRSQQRFVVTSLLLLFLASLMTISPPVITLSSAQSTSTTTTLTPLVIGSNNIANNDYYYSLLTSQDSGIFAGSCSVVGVSDSNFASYNFVAGVQTKYNFTASSLFNTSKLPNTLDTAYRADVLSDLMVSMAVMYLESTGELPFARTAAIPSTYLPSTYTTATTLVNPAFPNVPITLNMLLMHISSISEANFELGAAKGPTETAPSLEIFVSSLFSATTSIFSSTLQPGLSASYFYSRTNTALVSYIVERVLASSTTYASFSGIGEFVFSVILPPLRLTNTFLLNRNGKLIETTYPFSSTGTSDMRPYKSVQDLTSDGTGILTSYPIHASYFSDYMMYTSTRDLAMLSKQVFMPDGFYYNAIGTQMLATSLNIATGTLLYATGRTPGLFLFDPNLLCAMLYHAVGETGTLPYCHFNGTTIAAGASPFGLVATGGNNQVALICVPLNTSKTYCSVAEISFNTSLTWPAANAATGGDKAVGLAMVNLARFASDREPKPNGNAPTIASKLNGWYIFIGVVAALVVVVVAAFCADYFIQPPPPAKMVAPIMTGDGMGMRAGTALTEGARASNSMAAGNGAVGSTDEPVDGESPKNFRDTASTSSSITADSSSPPHHGQRNNRHQYRNGNNGSSNACWNNNSGSHSRMVNGDGDDGDYGGANDTTPCVLHRANRHGESSLRRRHHRPSSLHRLNCHNNNGEMSSDDGSNLTPDDGWGDHEVEMTERSSTGSQRPNPNGMLRFDAYI